MCEALAVVKDADPRGRRMQCVSGVRRSIEHVSIQLLSSAGELEDDERPATPDPYLPGVSKRQWEAKVSAWRREMSRLLDEVPAGATELAAAEEFGVWVEPSPPAVRGCRSLLQDGNCIPLAYSILTRDFCGGIDYCARLPTRCADVANHFGCSLTVVRLQASQQGACLLLPGKYFCHMRCHCCAAAVFPGSSSAIVWRGFSRHVLSMAQWVRRVEEVEGALLHITCSSEAGLDVDLTTGRGSRGTAAERGFMGADDDLLGGMAHGEDVSNACLSVVLNTLGAHVPTSVQGPFRALEHGDQLLSYLGLVLVRQPRGPTGRGRYVKWGPPRREAGLAASVGHFAAVILQPGNAAVIDRRAGLPAVREWRACSDIPDVVEHKWLLLLELGAQRPGPESGSMAPQEAVPHVPCDFSFELPRLPKIRLLERLNARPRGTQLHFAARLRELLVSHAACDAEICAEVKATARAEIVEKWRLGKEGAARRGTWMLWTFEARLNRVTVPRDAVEFQLFLKFLGALRGLAAFRAEWAIFAEREGLAGSIDFAARDSAGSLCICDWKRAKNFRSKFTNPWDIMKFPLGLLPDCQGNHYQVQLNIYRWMLERYYGARVAAMYVVCLHPDNCDQPFVDDVPVIRT
ncbi:unnamed protein product [Prorocentrum cordatum]|uniref:PD-(D/E)XK endonuclease-like domain-containing protein n=1 Tax=Prorocentrum cordatum TaxID=2364126 RepID=A0ABN9SM87_9DINO|nr:unnamed protein product [Polarella glacialis]